MADRFPDAPLFTLLYDEAGTKSRFAEHSITTSYPQRLNIRQDGFRKFLPLFPGAIERLPMTDCDVVLSSSSAFAHGAQTRTDAIHVCTATPPCGMPGSSRSARSRRSSLCCGQCCAPPSRAVDRGTARCPSA